MSLDCPIDEISQAGTNVLELPELTGNLKKLKGLSLNGEGITYISDSVKDLLCLNYLQIILTNIAELPECIGDLFALQSLVLCKNSELTRLPHSIVHLRELRLLKLDRCEKLSHLPDSHHRRSFQDLSDDESRRFSNLSRLSELSLKNCSALESLPSSLCKLRNL